MRSALYLLTFSFIILVSCTKDDVQKDCYNADALEELGWLSSAASELETGNLSEYQYIMQAEYDGELVFVFGNCCPFCGSVFMVYNCKGENIGNIGSGKDDVNPDILENGKIVWTSSNSQCNFN